MPPVLPIPRVPRRDIVRFDAWMTTESGLIEHIFNDFLEMLQGVSRHNILIELPNHAVLAELFARYAYKSSSCALVKRRRHVEL